MLEGLHTVDWANLEHAYGSAADTPEQIEALLNPAVDIFEEALGKLWASICHQGSVYDASSYAAPFLIEIVEHAPADRKPHILYLLAGLASRDMFAYRQREMISQNLDLHATGYRYWSYQGMIDEGNQYSDSQWIRRAHERVGEGIPLILRLWQTDDHDVRIAVLYWLSAFKELSDQILPTIAIWLKETDIPVQERCALILCAGSLSDAETTTFGYIKEYLQEDVHPALRFCAALALENCSRLPLPREAIDALIQTMIQPDAFDELFHNFPWFTLPLSSTHCEARDALGRLGQTVGLPGLIVALDGGSRTWRIADTLRVAEAVLDVAFYGNVVEYRDWSICTGSSAPYLPPSEDWRSEGIDNFFMDMRAEKIENSYYSYGFNYMGKPGIEISFEKDEAARLRTLREERHLSDAQRDAIVAIISCQPLWRIRTNLCDMYGLPDTQQGLRNLLEMDQRERHKREQEGLAEIARLSQEMGLYDE